MGFDKVWRGARLATMAGPAGPAAGALGIVERGAVATRGDRIAFVGAEADLPAGDARGAETVECEGRWITPGLIDCHTHLVFAGDRSDEFEKRLTGVAYADIARAGGGILSSVRATRAASEDDLVALARPRLAQLARDGVTTIEIKSGYGLEHETELRALRAAKRLGAEGTMRVATTYLGAHAVPPGRDRADYLDEMCVRTIPALAAEGLAEAVDAFCETIAFTPAECDRLFAAARAAGLSVKLHAEQLSNLGGAALAARHGALSADHLEHLDADGAAALAQAGTVAVLLPGAFYVLRERHAPPVAALRAAGAAIAVATDLNPGTSPIASLRLCAHMACTLFGLTVEEALLGVTRNGARALGRLGEIGTLEPGKAADFCVWSVERLAQLVAWIGLDPLEARVVGGRIVGGRAARGSSS